MASMIGFDTPRGHRRIAALLLALLLPLLSAHLLPLARADGAVQIIDAHTHLLRHIGGSEANDSKGRVGKRGGERSGSGATNWDASATTALAIMDKFGIAFAILSPPPFPAGREGAYGVAELQSVVRSHPDRFAFSAGGESLNPLILETPAGNVTPEVRRRFEQEAVAIANAGAAAFGELAAEHFSVHIGNHPYESAPPDHPLLLALADISAKYGMPIELHMEAVPRDMPFPEELAGPPNPSSLHENIAAFERLLDHNRQARIVWVHAGWDLTGERTVALMRSLLQRHPNLFMSVKSDRMGTRASAPFAPGGGLKPGWLAMLKAFPDRFVVGSDQFYDGEPLRSKRARAFVDALPEDLARRIANENVKHIYRLMAKP